MNGMYLDPAAYAGAVYAQMNDHQRRQYEAQLAESRLAEEELERKAFYAKIYDYQRRQDESRLAEEERRKELERKAAAYDAMLANRERIVISIRGGCVQAVFAERPERCEVIVIDGDKVPGANDPQLREAYAWNLAPILSMGEELQNAVNAMDGEDVICEQCGNTYRNEDGYDAWHCSQTCHDRYPYIQKNDA